MCRMIEQVLSAVNSPHESVTYRRSLNVPSSECVKPARKAKRPAAHAMEVGVRNPAEETDGHRANAYSQKHLEGIKPLSTLDSILACHTALLGEASRHLTPAARSRPLQPKSEHLKKPLLFDHPDNPGQFFTADASPYSMPVPIRHCSISLALHPDLHTHRRQRFLPLDFLH